MKIKYWLLIIFNTASIIGMIYVINNFGVRKEWSTLEYTNYFLSSMVIGLEIFFLLGYFLYTLQEEYGDDIIKFLNKKIP